MELGNRIQIDKLELIKHVADLIGAHHDKMDSAGTISPEIKAKSEGYIEALYHVENLLIYWGKDV